MFDILCMNTDTTHDKSFKMERKNGIDSYLLLLIKTPTIFTINGYEKHVGENTCMLYTPKTPQYYRPITDIHKNDWAHIIFEKDFIKHSGIYTNTPFEINFPEQAYSLFKVLTSVFYSQLNNKNEILKHISYSLILMLANNASPSVSTELYDKLLSLRKDIYNYPNRKWTIESMAKIVCLSPGYFQNVYRKTFSTTANSDVINAKISYAKDLLTDSSLNTKQISRMSGYKNDEHFYRQFKKSVGQSPSEYRKNLKSN